MKLLPIEYNSQRILTTEQLAEVYETDVKNIQMNFSRTKERFVEGKHYFLLEGDELAEFKNLVTNSGVVSKHTSRLYLWTERGANRHCKILDTDKAWEQFENLEETYFRVKENKLPLPSMPPETFARMLASAARFTNAHARIMIHEGHSWHDIGKMAKDVAIASGLPHSPLLGIPPEGEQMRFDGFS